MCLICASERVAAQEPTQTDKDSIAINALYRDWVKATSERGADGYVSYWVADGAVLPPNAPAVEGKNSIRQWIQKVLEDHSTKITNFIPGSLRVANGLATRRFTMLGERVPKKVASPSSSITNILTYCKSKLTVPGNSFIGCGAVTSNFP